MKLVSYFHANSDYRVSGPAQTVDSTRQLVNDVREGEMTMEYPANVTLRNLYYFWFAPTLTYQIGFPKTQRVRWLYVVGILMRLAVSGAIIVFLMVQTINPSIEILLDNVEKSGGVDPMLFAETLVKLAIPNTYMWLCIFYWFFHCWMNLWAELTCFGDRVFYKDWWNCSEIGSYWRLWNLPVHMWLVRHAYMPILRCGFKPWVANLFVFLISAVLHEFVISVPFHFVRYYAFLGMLGQMPLVAVTKWMDKKFKGSSMGNIIFWLAFCVVGQPMGVLMYALDLASLRRGGEGGGGVMGGKAGWGKEL